MNVIDPLWVSLSSLPWLGPAVSEPLEPAEWSETIGGLRGRLLLGEEANMNGTRVSVYLELENVSDFGSLMEIYFDYDAVQGEVLDPVGKSVDQSRAPENVVTPVPFWIMLPNDSTLRFRISLTGHAVRGDAGLGIGLASRHWLLPSATTGSYVLSASFRATPSEDRAHPRPWVGVLKLPTIRIPVRRP